MLSRKEVFLKIEYNRCTNSVFLNDDIVAIMYFYEFIIKLQLQCYGLLKYKLIVGNFTQQKNPKVILKMYIKYNFLPNAF